MLTTKTSAMKVLLDTNILLYAMDNSSKYNKVFIGILENPAYELYVSTKNISELIAVCSKLEIDKKIVLQYINDTILNICSLLFPNKQSTKVFLQIIENKQIKGNKVYDMEIASILIVNKIDRIATFNHKDFKEISEVTILEECF